jgi:hypothetical protein
MNHRKPWLALLSACAFLGACSESTEDDVPGNGIDQLERRLELHYHEDLLVRMASPGTTLADFTTDGCSGGLSVGWEYLAGHIAGIQKQHGTRPAWEHCCIEHDRRYHAGPGTAAASVEESFEARKQADLALQACVLETGHTRAPELSLEYGVSGEAVDTLYAAIAGLMYRAVRVGGMPCSGLPWRWGYGWPECG